MLAALKKLVRKTFGNSHFPAVRDFYYRRDLRKMLELQEAHSRMTYAEIEEAIGRKFLATFGRPLNWDNPQTYNEKINVSKLYMPTPEKTRLADKYLVREWISEKIGSEYLIPLLGVYDSFDEIDFNSLPQSFVIKCNHDSGSVTLVKDKHKIDIEVLRRKYDVLLKRNYAWMGWEMHYRAIKPKIIIEKYMGEAVNDYKFLCFDGRPCYCWVDFNRYTNHKRNMYNLEWELQPFNQWHYGNYEGEAKRPECFGEMKRIAAVLCEGFGHVRVDLYVIGGKIYFGEMTFTNGNGFEEITPNEWNYKLGALWPFDNTIRKKILSQQIRP